MVSFNRVQTGVFDVLVDGAKTDYQIVNGSMGVSGRDSANIYCIARNGELVKVLGPLNTCKKFMVAKFAPKGVR